MIWEKKGIKSAVLSRKIKKKIADLQTNGDIFTKKKGVRRRGRSSLHALDCRINSFVSLQDLGCLPWDLFPYPLR